MKGSSMSKHSFTRRTLLGAAAAITATSSLSITTRAAASSTKSINPVGVATLGFNKMTNAQLAAELAAHDIHLIQLFFAQTDSNYWKYNGRSDLADFTPDRARRIADIYRAAGITIHSLGVYTNLIHPDPAERGANIDYFEAMMKLAAAMNIRMLITEAGHHHADDGGHVEYHFRETVWKQTIDTARELVRRADQHDVTILVEPFYRGFFATAKRTRLFLEEVNSPRLRALLDPANLLEFNDLPEMFDQLGPFIDCMHAKDRKLHVDRGVPAGQGDLDYPLFVKLAAERVPRAPLIAEYVGPGDYQQALAHLYNAMPAR
jgi:sugar phosphate isomerase/epimerase